MNYENIKDIKTYNYEIINSHNPECIRKINRNKSIKIDYISEHNIFKKKYLKY